MCFFQSYPERFYFEGLLESAGGSVPTVQYLPIYFGNVCLRFLPVSADLLLSTAAGITLLIADAFMTVIIQNHKLLHLSFTANANNSV